MKYQIFLNEQRDEKGRHVGFFGFKPWHTMELADGGDIEAAEDEVVLEEIFRIYNIDHPAHYRNRSLSVGDVIVLDLGTPSVRGYTVEPAGFHKLDRFDYAISCDLPEAPSRMRSLAEKLTRAKEEAL